MSLPIEKELREVLEPYSKRIRKVLDKAFKDFLARRGAGNIYKRTDSADVFDSVIRVAIAEFNNKPGTVVFDGAVLVRGQGAGPVQKGDPPRQGRQHPHGRERQLPGSSDPVRGRAVGDEGRDLLEGERTRHRL